jgi:hypothetical protein
MKKFKTKSSYYSFDGNPIKEVEVERETANFYILKGGDRESKMSRYHQYHDTHKEAKEYLISECKRTIKNLEERIVNEKKDLERFESLTP